MEKATDPTALRGLLPLYTMTFLQGSSHLSIRRHTRSYCGPPLTVTVLLPSLADLSAAPTGLGHHALTVYTGNGPITGRYAANTRTVIEYLGIPYAKPPVGDLRFRLRRSAKLHVGYVKPLWLSALLSILTSTTGMVSFLDILASMPLLIQTTPVMAPLGFLDRWIKCFAIRTTLLSCR